MTASGLFFPEDPVSDEQEDRSDGCDEDAADVERLDFPESDEGSEKATDHAAGDADEDGDENPARVFARHDELRECAGHETEKDPGDDVHDSEGVELKAAKPNHDD